MAARGNKVVITPDAKGQYIEGVVSGTPKPGTVMEIETPFYQGGKHLFRVYQPGTDGVRRTLYVLREDQNQGKTIEDAYVDGTRCFLYVPLPGDELNMLYANVAGTADDHAVLEIATVDSGTGKLIAAAGTEGMIPFQLLTAITDPTADFLAPVVVIGN